MERHHFFVFLLLFLVACFAKRLEVFNRIRTTGAQGHNVIDHQHVVKSARQDLSRFQGVTTVT